jgi:acid phosphatase class B
VTIDKGHRQEYFAGDEIQIFAQNSDKDVDAERAAIAASISFLRF